MGHSTEHLHLLPKKVQFVQSHDEISDTIAVDRAPDMSLQCHSVESTPLLSSSQSQTKPTQTHYGTDLTKELTRQLYTSVPSAVERLLYNVPWLLGLRVVGHACPAQEMAGAALASTIVNVLGLSIAEGLATGVTTLVGQANGTGRNLEYKEKTTNKEKYTGYGGPNCRSHDEEKAEKYREHLLRVYLYRGVSTTLIFTVPIGMLWLKKGFVQNSLVYFGQDGTVSKLTESYLRILAPGLWFYSVHGILCTWFQAIELAHVTMYAVLFGVSVHVPSLYFLVYGTNLGYLGAAWATVIFQCVQPLLIIYLWKSQKSIFAVRQSCSALSSSDIEREKNSIVETSGIKAQHFAKEMIQAVLCSRGIGQYLALALPGVVLVSEWWASEFAVFLSGHIRRPDPATNVDAMTIYQSINAFCFSLSQGCSVGGSTRVSNALGASSAHDARLAATVSIFICTLVTLGMSIILYFSPHEFFPSLFSPNIVVVRETSKTIPLLLFYVVFDGLSATLNGIIKGCGRQGVVMPIIVFAYWVVGVPMAYFLTFSREIQSHGTHGAMSQGFYRGGIVGLVWGLTVGTAVHMTLLVIFVVWKVDWEEERKRAHSRVQLERTTLR